MPTSESLLSTRPLRKALTPVPSDSAVVRIQMLSELEEIISYKEATAVGNSERRAVIQKTWMKRSVVPAITQIRR